MELSVRIARRERGQSAWLTLRRIATWPARVFAAREAMRHLAELSAHELKDIGLTPWDLSDATALPSVADPTVWLAARVRERRRRS